jgi:tetratricopeptide (TPR) repeat protein
MRPPPRIIYASFLVLLLSVKAYAGPSLHEITLALDHAHGQAGIMRQLPALEAMGAGQRPETDALTELSRAYYLLGEAEKDKRKKEAWLDRSVMTADRAIKAAPPGHRALYWRSMSLLLKADISGPVKALGYVKEALKGLEAVSEADPSYDSAGAYRSRGKVLIDAPSWSFIGDRKMGLKLLLKATAIAPGNLVNRLYLAQAYLKNGDRTRAGEELTYIKSAPVDPEDRDDIEARQEAKKLASDSGL